MRLSSLCQELYSLKKTLSVAVLFLIVVQTQLSSNRLTAPDNPIHHPILKITVKGHFYKLHFCSVARPLCHVFEIGKKSFFSVLFFERMK